MGDAVFLPDPIKGTINLFDAAVPLVLFLFYAAGACAANRTTRARGASALIDREFGHAGRRLWASDCCLRRHAIFISAEPFAESPVEIGRGAIDEFPPQWVALLASESPEFIIAIPSPALRGSVGIGTLISSKVNQWTLLVGAIPIVYAISLGGWSGLPLDERQTEELILTSAQSLLATILISDLRFSRRDAIMLALLFIGQFAFTSTHVRYLFIVMYLLIAAWLLVSGGSERRTMFFSLIWARDDVGAKRASYRRVRSRPPRRQRCRPRDGGDARRARARRCRGLRRATAARALRAPPAPRTLRRRPPAPRRRSRAR